MKRASAVIFALLFCLMWSVTVFAENIFIIEDGEDEYIAQSPVTTTQPAETTTAATEFGDILNGDTLAGYFDSFKDMFGDGVDSFMDELGALENLAGETTTAEASTGLPSINGGEYVPATQAAALTTSASSADNAEDEKEEDTGDDDRVYQEELPSVLIIDNSAGDDSWGISGSTLTLIVFVAAIVILILVVIVTLVIMTHKTSFDSSVKTRSTLPGISQSDALARFIEGDDSEDDSDDDNYSNITYWEDE